MSDLPPWELGEVFQLPGFDGPSVSEAFWGSDYTPQEDSGFGSSYHSVGMLCWRKYYFKNVEGLVPSWVDDTGLTPRNKAVSRGLLMHHLHEVIYGGDRGRVLPMSQEAVERAYMRLGWVAKFQPYQELVAECERLASAYLEKHLAADRYHYEVVSVEEPAHVRHVVDGEEFLYTVRYDLRVRERASGLHFILEHKHYEQFGWWHRRVLPLSLQAQGQAYTFTRAFPRVPFGGVIFNVVVATKKVDCQRVPVAFSASRLENFERQLWSWHSLRHQMAREGWPQNFATCQYPYPGARAGLCDYFDICFAELGPEEIRNRPAPAGFVRKDRLLRREHFRT